MEDDAFSMNALILLILDSGFGSEEKLVLVALVLIFAIKTMTEIVSMKLSLRT